MTIVVTGATGQLGRLVVENLLDRGVPAADIVAVGRSTDKIADLATRGVTVVAADYADPASLDAAFAGADKVLLVSSSDFNDRAGQHRNAIDAAQPSRRQPPRLHLGPEGDDVVDPADGRPQGHRGVPGGVGRAQHGAAQRLVRGELHGAGGWLPGARDGRISWRRKGQHRAAKRLRGGRSRRPDHRRSRRARSTSSAARRSRWPSSRRSCPRRPAPRLRMRTSRRRCSPGSSPMPACPHPCRWCSRTLTAASPQASSTWIQPIWPHCLDVRPRRPRALCGKPSALADLRTTPTHVAKAQLAWGSVLHQPADPIDGGESS